MRSPDAYEHLSGLGGAGVGLHKQQNLQESAGPIFVTLQILQHSSVEIALQINGLRVVQGGLRTLSSPFQRFTDGCQRQLTLRVRFSRFLKRPLLTPPDPLKRPIGFVTPKDKSMKA